MSVYLYMSDLPAIRISNAEMAYHSHYRSFININGVYVKDTSAPFFSYKQTENANCWIRKSALSGYWEIHSDPVGTLSTEEPTTIAVSNATDSELPFDASWEWSSNMTRYTSKSIPLIIEEQTIYKQMLCDSVKIKIYTRSAYRVLYKTAQIYTNGKWYYFGFSNIDRYVGDLLVTQATGETTVLTCSTPTALGTDRSWSSQQQGGSGGVSGNSIEKNETSTHTHVVNISLSYVNGVWVYDDGSHIAHGSGSPYPWFCRYISDDTSFDAKIPVNFITKLH